MNFQVAQYDQDTYISLQGLVNKNNGFWRSAKQAKYAPKHMELRTDYETMKHYFGFEAPEGSCVASVSVQYSFADYGSRSKVPGLIFFVLDDLGVMAKYKVGGRGNLGDGWGPDPKKCKLEWERPSDVVPPDFSQEINAAEEAARIEAERLAARPALVEGRQTLVGTIKSTKSVAHGFGYYGGYSLKGVIELDNGNRVYGTIPSTVPDEVGRKIQFDAKVTLSADDAHFGFFSRPTKVKEVV